MKKIRTAVLMLMAGLYLQWAWLMVTTGVFAATGTETAAQHATESETSSSGSQYSITISNPKDGDTYKVYKIFDATLTSDSQNAAYTITDNSKWFSVIKGYMNNDTMPQTTTDVNGNTETPTVTTVTAVTDTNGNAKIPTEYTGSGLTMTKAMGKENTYVVTIEDNTFHPSKFAEYLKVNTNGKTAVNGENGAGTKYNATTGDGGKLKIGLDSAGYYLVTCSNSKHGSANDETPAALAELTTTNKEVTIRDKNSGLDKKQKNQGETNYADDALAVQIGDVVDYQVEDIIPDTAGFTKYNYEITDTMLKGLTLNGKDGKPDLQIYINDKEIEKYDKWTVTPIYDIYGENETVTTSTGTPYTMTTTTTTTTKAEDPTPTTTTTTSAADSDSENTITTNTTVLVGFKLKCDLLQSGYSKDDKLKIKYSATVNEYAKYGKYTNKVEMKFENDVTSGTDTDTTEVYNAQIKVIKHETNQENTKLPGATFKLYKLNNNSEKLYYRFYDGKVDFQKEESGYQGTQYITDTNGLIYFTGLEPGTYYLTETKAPDGYNLMTSDKEVVIEEKEILVNNSGTVTSPKKVKDNVDCICQVKVPNGKGTILPDTGGMGTKIFYIAGFALFLSAIVAFIVRRSMKEKD